MNIKRRRIVRPSSDSSRSAEGVRTSVTDRVALTDGAPLAVDPKEPDRSNQPREGETFGSEFLDNMAHQMVAPLQSIEMNCSNILDGLVPEELRDTRLREVVGHVRVLEQLARRMRFLHELVSGKEVRHESLEFEKIVTTWIDGFNNYLPMTRAMQMGVDIDDARMNALPDVIASHLAAHQVIVNLYDNALKYGQPQSRILVRARVEERFILNEFSHQAKVKLTPDAVAQMFTRGFRATEARQMSASGTGIGMWISKQLMTALGGDLRAFPTDGSGRTRFVLYWRLA